MEDIVLFHDSTYFAVLQQWTFKQYLNCCYVCVYIYLILYHCTLYVIQISFVGYFYLAAVATFLYYSIYTDVLQLNKWCYFIIQWNTFNGGKNSILHFRWHIYSPIKCYSVWWKQCLQRKHCKIIRRGRYMEQMREKRRKLKAKA